MSEIDKTGLKKIKDSLLKRAVGYYADEIVEEFSVEDGQEKLIKKKVTKKYVAGDMTATKMLLDYFGEATENYASLSDEELDREAIRLLKEYQKLTNLDMAKELKNKSE